MEAKIYNQKGESIENLELPKSIFGLPNNPDLLHQVTVSIRSNQRPVTAKSKDRSEVSGGGKKPWRQKGTGRARHGSRRSPIWVGGGVTFGPNAQRDYSKKINQKMKAKALFTALSQKQANGQLIFLEDIKLNEAKTSEAKSIVENLFQVAGFNDSDEKKKNLFYIAVPEMKEDVKRAFGNIGNTSIIDFDSLNVLDVVNCRYFIISEPKTSIDKLINKYQKTFSKSTDSAKVEAKV